MMQLIESQLPSVGADLVTAIRTAARDLIRELGFLNRGLAGTDLSASAVHAIVEIGARGELTAAQLGTLLLLEKSTVSRLVGALVVRGEVAEMASKGDGRAKLLSLTSRGRATLACITRFAQAQVDAAIALRDPGTRNAILRGLDQYATALRDARLGRTQTSVSPMIETGAAPGLAGRIIAMHGEYYARTLDLPAQFEARVAGGMAEFLPRLAHPDNRLWHARSGDDLLGTIAIDGQDLGEGRAHLRWFIVADAARGTGLGRRLLDLALNFCDTRGFAEVHLWTIQGLDAARGLYERRGFALAEEYRGDQWGRAVPEQRFVRTRPAATS